MNTMIDWIMFKFDMFWMYVSDFWHYKPEDIDQCCRR